MQIVANGVALEIEDHGPAQGEPLLLVMGLGMQLLAWHEDFVASLVTAGFRVVRFDNRDIGLSQSFDPAGVPSLALSAARYALGWRIRPAYTLSDMADDCVGILDALRIPAAHICGASMGGMIAQRMADRHPERVRSLTLMMTSSGSRKLPGPTLKVRAAMLTRPARPDDVASIVEHYIRLYGLIGSPAYPPPREFLRQRFTTSITRSNRPDGTARQIVAIAADGDRSALLAALKVPTHVIHGRADPLIPVPAAHDLVARIPGATLDVIDGMGHDLPVELWPRYVEGIAGAADRA